MNHPLILLLGVPCANQQGNKEKRDMGAVLSTFQSTGHMARKEPPSVTISSRPGHQGHRET